MSRATLRKTVMTWWWDRVGPGRLQNTLSRVGCLIAGHVQGRSVYCDWCGTPVRFRRARR